MGTKLVNVNGVKRWVKLEDEVIDVPIPILSFRQSMGEILREHRIRAGLSLRQFPGVSIGHLSEVERGKKEASSEVLEDICARLGLSIPDLLRKTADRMDSPVNP